MVWFRGHQPSLSIRYTMKTEQIHPVGITAIRLTAPGRGAVATVRLSCSLAEHAVAIDGAFVAANGTLASSVPVDRVLFGFWRGEDVVVVRTTETEWEVHCHGGEAAVTRILAEFCADASAIAVLPSALDQLLLQARTTKTARLILAHSNGILRNTLITAIQADAPEEFRQQLSDLLHWECLANHLVTPWRVVIAGPPNAGKSSLLNAIAGYERSIVCDRPGTTRDAVRTELVLSGWPFCFVDTAGIRQHFDDPVESQGSTHAQNLLNTADLILIAVDNAVGWTGDHDDIVLQIPEHCKRAVVSCKSDLAVSGETSPEKLPLLLTSAEQGDGIRELTEWITAELIVQEPTLKTPLPLAGTAGICRVLCQRMDEGESAVVLQQELCQWLKSQSW